MSRVASLEGAHRADGRDRYGQTHFYCEVLYIPGVLAGLGLAQASYITTHPMMLTQIQVRHGLSEQRQCQLGGKEGPWRLWRAATCALCRVRGRKPVG
jgi:hypothetical protein